MCSGFANCTPGVVRVRFGDGSDKDDVSVSRITCITAGYVRRFWLRVPFGADFHLYQPTSPVVTVEHGSDCGRGGDGGAISCSAPELAHLLPRQHAELSRLLVGSKLEVKFVSEVSFVDCVSSSPGVSCSSVKRSHVVLEYGRSFPPVLRYLVTGYDNRLAVEFDESAFYLHSAVSSLRD
ncbi:hypothetical protein DINM_005688 [Dirofilaria immitis]|nr:hypothetical protein [Dirofilaria immitis]